MTTLDALKDLLDAYAVNDPGDVDGWEIKVHSEVTRVTAADPAIHVNPASAFAAASDLVDRILSLGYRQVFAGTISAKSPPDHEDDAVTYRGVINVGLKPSAD